MSSNKTQNYNLHSWLPQDEFHLTEINENFAKLDTALKAEANTRISGLAAKGELVVGSWSGSYKEQPIIDLGKPIKALLLENGRGWRGSDGDVRLFGGLILPGKNFYNDMVTITGTKFQLVTISNVMTTWTCYYMAWVEA